MPQATRRNYQYHLKSLLVKADLLTDTDGLESFDFPSAMNPELMYSPMSSSCRAVLMCIKEMNLRVDLKKMDIQRKMEHMMAWFVKCRLHSSQDRASPSKKP
ncbi:hypothetical protein FJT64_000584 [Amphibalanus amphitrite]|uniref:Uncharacterized protein n=1 Tax=Amphibalanus amphitrite TaxID=1232801 RepID=A0A6A4VZK5_AMPAM|nr:hypothetical protein FJT64_000584 [Amphibalanus amphitrite]